MTSFLAELAPREQGNPGARRVEASMDPRGPGAWASVVRDLSWTKDVSDNL